MVTMVTMVTDTTLPGNSDTGEVYLYLWFYMSHTMAGFVDALVQIQCNADMQRSATRMLYQATSVLSTGGGGSEEGKNRGAGRLSVIGPGTFNSTSNNETFPRRGSSLLRANRAAIDNSTTSTSPGGGGQLSPAATAGTSPLVATTTVADPTPTTAAVTGGTTPALITGTTLVDPLENVPEPTTSTILQG
eukprot:sb/3471169/